MKRTAILEDVYQATINKMRTSKKASMKDIISLAKHMQRNKMDCHIVIAGQNGLGKTVLELGTGLQFYNNDEHALFSNLITAENTTNDLVLYILKNKKTLCMIDELNVFLDYKQHMDTMQRHLVTSFELARSKEIIFLGCVRTPEKLTYNYRNGKMSICLWVLDRFEEGGAYAAVLIAPASIEAEDRFGFDLLPPWKSVV